MDLENGSPQEHLLGAYSYNYSSVDEPLLQKTLLKALNSKNFRTFKNIVEHHLYRQPSVLNLNQAFPNHNEETCLDIASRNGLTEFVDFLLRKGANPNRVNRMYNRAPIHFATENGHEATLAVLLTNPMTNPMTNPNLEAGQQTALHIAVRQKNLTCAKQLLENGASANIPNSQGLTALHLAAMKDQYNMVQLILNNCIQCPDLDSYKDCNEKTTREVIQQKMDISLPPRCEIREINAHDLKYYLIANDETNFLRSLEVVEAEVFRGVAEDLLELAARHDFLEAVTRILDTPREGAFSVKRAAQIAIQRSHHKILQELLNAEPDVANDLLMDACQELGMPGKRGVDCTSGRLECLRLILEQDNVDVRCVDKKGNTPLHYAARAGCREAVILLLERGSYIGHMNKFNVPPIADISTNTLSHYFDNCLQTRKERTNEYTLEFDYRCLMSHDVGKTHLATHEMEVFQYIASNSGLKQLLKHPLISSFLYLKWYRMRYFLFVNFAFYVIFYVLLNSYILSMTYYEPSNKNETADGSVNVVSGPSISQNTSWNHENLLWSFTSVVLLLFICREVIQLVSCPWHYAKSLENWLEIALIVLTFLLLSGAGGLQIGAIAILLSAWNLVLLISQHPRMSIGIEMFRTVSFNFVRVLFPYIFLIIAFALAFYTLFKDDSAKDDKFSNPAYSLFKTIIMLTGEFDANDIPFLSHPFWSRFIFVLFVFLIAIVLFNLLNGLAVSDTAEILCKAELISLISRIRLIAYIENVAIGDPFRRWWLCCNVAHRPRWNPFAFIAKRIFLFPNYLRDGKISVRPSDSLYAYDTDRHYEKYVCDESVRSDKRPTILTMDSNIIKRAKRIICDRKQFTDNEKIIIALSKLQEKLTTMEATLDTIKLAIGNNNSTAESLRES